MERERERGRVRRGREELGTRPDTAHTTKYVRPTCIVSPARAQQKKAKQNKALSPRPGASDGGSPSGRRPSGAIGGGVASPRLVSGWHANSHTSMRIHARRAACVTPASLLSCPHAAIPHTTPHATHNTQHTAHPASAACEPPGRRLKSTLAQHAESEPTSVAHAKHTHQDVAQ